MSTDLSALRPIQRFLRLPRRHPQSAAALAYLITQFTKIPLGYHFQWGPTGIEVTQSRRPDSPALSPTLTPTQQNDLRRLHLLLRHPHTTVAYNEPWIRLVAALYWLRMREGLTRQAARRRLHALFPEQGRHISQAEARLFSGAKL